MSILQDFKNSIQTLVTFIGLSGSSLGLSVLIQPFIAAKLVGGPEEQLLANISSGVCGLSTFIGLALIRGRKFKESQKLLQTSSALCVVFLIILLLLRILAERIALERLGDTVYWVMRYVSYVAFFACIGVTISISWYILDDWSRRRRKYP